MNVFQKMIVDRAKRIVKNEGPKPNTLSIKEINSFFTSNYPETLGEDLSEITYFTALKILSESLGKLSIHLKDGENKRIHDHPALMKLMGRPNEYMTPSVFRLLMEFNRNHYGNAYAWIKTDRKGTLQGLYPLEPMQVRIFVDDEAIFSKTDRYFFEYTSPKTQEKYRLHPDEVIHLKGGISQDGLVGMSVRETLARSLDGSKQSQKFLNELYDRGLTANAVLQYTGDLSKEKKKALIEEVADFSGDFSTDRIIPLPLGMTIEPLDLKLTDSQFFELKKFSALQIAAAYGIKPNHLNNYEKSSYANSEMQNLTFYVDTLLYILTQWEDELDYKLLTEEERKKGLSFEFNIAKILRGDLKTQAESIKQYVTGSVYTINEARGHAGLPPVEGGDVVMANGSYVNLENLGAAYKRQQKGGEEEDGLSENQE